MGTVYSDLSSSYTEIEKLKKDDMAVKQPCLSGLYSTLKKAVFQLSNTYEVHLTMLKKFPSLRDIACDQQDAINDYIKELGE